MSEHPEDNLVMNYYQVEAVVENQGASNGVDFGEQDERYEASLKGLGDGDGVFYADDEEHQEHQQHQQQHFLPNVVQTENSVLMKQQTQQKQ